MTAATAYPPAAGGSHDPSTSGVRGGLRFRMRPVQAALLFAVVVLLLSPAFIGEDRRDHLRSYVAASIQKTPGSQQVAQPTGGLDPHQVPLTLEARLEHFLSRPALDHGESEIVNAYQCPHYTFSRDTYFFHEADEGARIDRWKKLDKNAVKLARSKIVEYFKELDKKKVPLIWDRSMERDTPAHLRRGIIYTGGGHWKDIERLRWSLDVLRNVLKSTLPVEIYHYEGEFADEKLRKEFIDDYGVTLVQSSAKKTDGKAWQIKNAAFVDTRFTQFVYMDSDNIPLSDPAELFESVEFKQGGSVFWPDLNKDHPENAIWRVLGRDCSDEHWPAESGQVLFDKSGNNGLNLAVLHLSNHMMLESDFYGDLGYGDKDTYRYSFYALGLPYQMPSRMFSSVGGYQRMDARSDPDFFCGHSLLQWALTPQSAKHDPNFEPKPGFLHTILLKARYGLQPDKLLSHVKRPRLNQINDERLVRTLYQFTGECFAIDLKGPDGAPNAPNSYGDGQGVEIQTFEEVLGYKPEVWEWIRDNSKKIAGINVPGE